MTGYGYPSNFRYGTGGYSPSGVVTPISLIANVELWPSGSPTADGGTTGAIDTTGATLLAALVTFSSATPPTLSDSKGNTWAALTARVSHGAAPGAARLYYVAGPTVGTGHTFTLTGVNSFSSVQVAAFDNVVATTPFDQENGAASAGDITTLQPGSITPTVNNELVLTGLMYLDGTAAVVPSIDSDFTITDYLSTNAIYGGALAYKVQTAAAAVNPTWSSNAVAERMAAVSASFKHS